MAKSNNELTISEIVERVKEGETIIIRDIGTFKKKEVAAKSGVSKLGGTEKEWHSDAFTTVAFKPAKSLKF